MDGPGAHGTTVGRYRSRFDADIAIAMLTGRGIPATLAGPADTGAVGPYEVLVPPERAREAATFLPAPPPGQGPAPGPTTTTDPIRPASPGRLPAVGPVDAAPARRSGPERPTSSPWFGLKLAGGIIVFLLVASLALQVMAFVNRLVSGLLTVALLAVVGWVAWRVVSRGRRGARPDRP